MNKAYKHKPQFTPMQRFWQLLAAEKREIVYLYIYAIVAGLISLSLPLGIQSIIAFVSSGQITVSVVVLITLIVLGLLIVGGMQIMQLWLVEYIQQRIFARTAFDFAYRVPRLQSEALHRYYPPELMNRFSDTVVLQKSMAKLLTDFTTSAIQIIFGLILLSFYHPYFIVFGMILVIVLIGILYLTSSRGIDTSITESKYKYKLLAWLQEMARSMNAFKLGGQSELPSQKTNGFVTSYLKARKQHFRVLMTQYFSFVGFKTVITGGLLVLGAVLVIQREINIGQFVASEIVIILIMTAVEKIIIKLDTIYDLLTSLDKLGQVTDMPLEEERGMPVPDTGQGLSIQVRSLRYQYPNLEEFAIDGISFDVQASERVCIAGFNRSGKSTLSQLLLGLYENYEGSIAYNHLSMRDLNKNNLRRLIGDNTSKEQVFDGTILENITLGIPNVPVEDVIWATDNVGLTDFIHELPDGLQTELTGGSIRLPASVARKIIMARCLVRRPKMLLLDDFWGGMEKQEKLRLIQMLSSPEFSWTLLIISNDPEVMAICDRTMLLKDGQLVASGHFEEIRHSTPYQQLATLTV
ncbi:peptidase domain-containing ABC transporter [Pontibacter indicus]|uniref:ABC-type bacteriocin/lantibiotic exporter, contains an N-terminal double-glycine peptidase domain n=1 Tax=Pontibacter indicus TaxID=1317125 RepID=A0A1R3XHL1_9BACT|nr:ABC transporter ATP-binding protein [Pontibacter indicus]SIT90874.1 ABC-type bacteriocin/lantibiotic exporter, contains an N-terminal double-glycine peptidase domain [Pontibacter indicus]